MASDFDNTLFFMFKTPQYRPGDREAIRAFQEAGGLFGVSTGRSLTGVLKAALDDVHFDFFILASGSLVLDGHQQVLDKRTVDVAYVRALYERYCRSAEAVIQANDTVYTFDEPRYGMQTHIDDFADLAGADIYGISFYAGSDENAHAIAREIEQTYGGSLTAYANTTVVDVVGYGCSKGRAFQVVRQKLAIDRMGAIGDSYNDTPMFAPADISFTFSYAPQAVQDEADHIVGNVRTAIDILCAD